LNDFYELYKNFMRIKKMGWIKTMRNGSTGVGYTFESLLNKDEESFNVPDFGDIEIKTKRYFTKGYIELFNAVPDGDYLFPIKNLLNKYGYKTRKNPNSKAIVGDVYANKDSMIGLYYVYRLKVDRNSKIIRLYISDFEGNLLDSSVTWSFAYLKEKLYRKLKYLALIYAKSKYINGTEYFLYNRISFYKLISFDSFLELIEDGKIHIQFNARYIDNGVTKKYHDHGTAFKIHEKDIQFLFN